MKALTYKVATPCIEWTTGGMSNERPTHLDLFSGIGGFALAAEWAGFRTIGFAEIGPYGSRVLQKHWPTTRNYGDIRNVPSGLKYNLLTAGFPCQDASVAKQNAKGINGSRTGLWFPTLDIIRRDKPDVVQLENVPALRTRGADEILFGLEESGYTAQAFVVGAWSVGAAQARERVWITAHLAEIGESRPSTSTDSGQVGSRWESGKTYLQGTDWRTRPLIDSGTPPVLCRATDGIPHWMDRIECLGESIVPQVAYVFIKAIHDLITKA